MPMVTIQVTPETPCTPEQKAAVYKGVAQLLLDVFGTPVERTWVHIQEIDRANWGAGGLPLAEFLER